MCADHAAPNNATTCTTEGPGGADVADYSADATPGIAFEAPIRWLQNMMVSLDAHTPADDCDHDGDGDHGCPNGQYAPGAADQLTRGPVLDVVLDQEAKLQIYAAKVRFDADHTMCSTTLDGDCHDITRTLTVPTGGRSSPTWTSRTPDARLTCSASPARATSPTTLSTA